MWAHYIKDPVLQADGNGIIATLGSGDSSESVSQPGAKATFQFSDRPCLKTIMWRAIEKDTQSLASACTCGHAHLHIHVHVLSHRHVMILEGEKWVENGN